MNICEQCHMIWDVKESAALSLARYYPTDLSFSTSALTNSVLIKNTSAKQREESVSGLKLDNMRLL